MKLFNCLRYKVDASRKWRKSYGALTPKPIQKVYHKKLDISAAKHLINFLFGTNLLQDVAFSTTTLKYDTAEKQTMSRAVLTAMKSHVIEEYKRFCSDLQMASPLSYSALWKILRAIKPSQRHAMAGLDNLTADGLKGYLILSEDMKICDNSKERKLLQQHLEDGKQYLKIGYRMHCKDVSPIDLSRVA